jgi:hypothetical protein
MEPKVESKKGMSDWRKSKKARLYVIGGLLVIVAVLAFLFEGLRIWMLGIAILLLAALGLEATSTDVDLGSMMQGNSVSESMIERDADGNLVENEDGGFMTSIWRDLNGNAVPEGTAGAKGEDQFNCADFATQGEAQVFFDNAGGVANDINRLDGNKDGVACQSLPAGA